MTWVEVQDNRIRVRGYGRGTPVLLLHGLGSSGADWAFQITPLASHFHVLAADLPGCGESPARSVQASIGAFAALLWQVLDRLHCARPMLVGFSLGGAVALEMALQRPESCRRLVTINSLPSYRVDHWRKALELHAQLAMVRVLGLPRTARIVARRLFPHPWQAPMRARVEQVVGEQNPDVYLRLARALAAWCAADRIQHLRCPMLMLAGEHDYTGIEEKRRWAGKLGAQFRLVEGSGHGTPFDAIEACNRALLAFLAGGESPEGLRADPPEAAPAAAPSLPPEVPPGAGQPAERCA